MAIFITSDWHFSHKNIMGEGGFVKTRKHFSSVEEMNSTIITSINSVVQPKDTLIHLGDIALNIKNAPLLELLKEINGNLVLVTGNHDNSKTMKYLSNNNYNYMGKPKFEFIEVGTTMKRSGIKYFLSHYPIGLGEHRAKMRSICGHIHDIPAKEANCINVGIDSPEIPSEIPFGTPLELNMAFDLVDEKWEAWKRLSNGV